MYREDEHGPVLEGCVPNFVQFNSKTGKRRHPTEKPVQLLRYLIALVSNETDLLLDPFAGSSSLGEAADAMGRYAILVEKDSEFFAIGSQRISDLERNTLNFSE
jgi:site-specific DNA-methyltransferase (adenine-specific)